MLISFVFGSLLQTDYAHGCYFPCTRATLITAAGTAVLGVAAALDPVFSVFGVVVTVGGKISSMCNLGGAGGTFLANLRATLWIRLQMICIGRTKAKAAAVIAKQRHQASREEKQKKREKRGIEPLSESEWLSLVQDIHYASKVYKKGTKMHPGYKERYLVLKEGKLWFYRISDLALNEFDKYDVSQSEPRGTWSLYGNEVHKMDAHEDSYHHQETGHNKGFTITNADGVSRRFMLHQEATRSKWVRKIKKVIKLYKRPPMAVQQVQLMNAQSDYDKAEMDLPEPFASFSMAGSFLDRRTDFGSFRKPGKSRVGDPVVHGSLAFQRAPDYWTAVVLPAPVRGQTPPLSPGPVVAASASHPFISKPPGNLAYGGNGTTRTSARLGNGTTRTSARWSNGTLPAVAVGATVAGAGIMAAVAAGGFNRSAFILILCRLSARRRQACWAYYVSIVFDVACHYFESVLLC